jgi:lactoylglutathione lyase
MPMTMAKKSKRMAAGKKTARGRSRRGTRGSGRKASARPARRLAGVRKPQGLQLRVVEPSLTVNDVLASMSWYRDTLGFVVKERWEREGRLEGVELGAGRVSLYLMQDDWKKGRDRVKGEGFRLYFTTAENVDRLAERIKQHGGTLTHEPHDEPWGGRAFAFADPDGFKMTVTNA